MATKSGLTEEKVLTGEDYKLLDMGHKMDGLSEDMLGPVISNVIGWSMDPGMDPSNFDEEAPKKADDPEVDLDAKNKARKVLEVLLEGVPEEVAKRILEIQGNAADAYQKFLKEEITEEEYGIEIDYPYYAVRRLLLTSSFNGKISTFMDMFNAKQKH